MVRKIIGFTGRMHSGKDTAGEYLCCTHGFRRFAFADALKRGVQAMAGFTPEQCWGEAKDSVDDFWGVTPRQMLQEVGTFMRDNYRDDFWACRLEKYAQENPDHDITVTDVRFPNEVDLIHRLGGKVVRVWRRETMQEIVQHVSEQQSFDNVDAVIHNDSSFGELYKQIDGLLAEWYNTPVPEPLSDGRHFMESALED